MCCIYADVLAKLLERIKKVSKNWKLSVATPTVLVSTAKHKSTLGKTHVNSIIFDGAALILLKAVSASPYTVTTFYIIKKICERLDDSCTVRYKMVIKIYHT